MKVLAILPGRVVWISDSPWGLWVYYENPKKWWQFWRREIAYRHLCPHADEWEDCPVCCH